MSRVFLLSLLGRFGNTMFQTAFALGYAERHGMTVMLDGSWIGESIFDLRFPRYQGPPLPRFEECDIGNEHGDVSYRSYSQSQRCADFYTVEQCKRWFKLRPNVSETLLKMDMTTEPDFLVGHLRRGDLAGYGYALVSENSYRRAAEKFMIGFGHELCFVREEAPRRNVWFPSDMDFLPDFWRLMRAPVLFRGNSSFSFWSALLGEHQRVFSPVIDGLVGGIEHDVEFVEGNWPKLSHHEFVTDIHIREK